MNPRAFLSFAVHRGEIVQISGEDGHHFSRVLRLRKGEHLAVASQGAGYLCDITEVDGQAGTIQVCVKEQIASHEPPVEVYLAQAMPKGDKLDDILQHGTELGFAGYLLFSGARSVVRIEAKKLANRMERWTKIVKEAASQAQRDVIPSVQYAADRRQIEEWVERLRPDAILFLDEDERESALPLIFERLRSPKRIVLCVGPEGGWDDAERRFWADIDGGQKITLGPRILRTETAGLVAGAATLYHYGAMGGN